MFSVGSIVLVDYLPAMLNEDKSFTIWANVLNVVGGVGFFLAALKFIILYRQSYNNDELLFAGHAMLFGIAGVLFVNSTIWDMQWWLWHFLRLFAYIIALYFLYKEFKSEIHAVELKNKKLDLANKKIASYLGLIDRYVITSTTDVHGKIIDASQAFCEISGYNIYELIGKSHSIVRAPDVSQNFYKQMWDQLQKDQIWSGEIKNQKKDGSTYWVHATISPIYDENGSKIGYTAIRQDITDKKIIEEISITDSLTKIYNRRHFDDFIPNLINSAKRKNVLFAFVMFDIDYFKYYNDTYGHKMGDNTLVEIGRISKEILRRADDYCFRLGGEEFGAVFIVDHKDQALEIANSIKEKIEELHIEHKKNKVSKYVTASFGLVCKRALEIDSLDQLYQEADKLLYEAKSLGRNKVVLNP
jgi:diguanylate cyclase (GGDEF)-like protein/PAS domain S-box-containing protein